jgi:hypothetical protein
MTNFWELNARVGAMQVKTKSNYQLTERSVLSQRVSSMFSNDSWG